MNFADKLKEVRLSRGYSQAQVANSAGIQLPTYQNYESGTEEPDIFILANLVLALNTTADELLGLIGKN